MKNKSYRIMLVLAVISLVIATIEGFIYYNSEQYSNAFFRFLLVIQNSIGAFAFKPSISIKDAMALMQSSSSVFKTAIGYAYGLAVFTAPYCTIAFVYKMLERILNAVFVIRKRRNYEHIVIFGYNDIVKEILKNMDNSSAVKRCVHIVSAEEVPTEECYRLTRRQCLIHNFDFLKADGRELENMINVTAINKASNILLFENSSIQNFSLLQLFKLNTDDSNGKTSLIPGTKISCRCEDEYVRRLIADYYDNRKSTASGYDLELISLSEMQVHKMYSDNPLYSYYKDSSVPVSQWNLNLLIVGFGQVGQQALLQAMNLGVVHTENSIKIDVIDYDIEKKAEMFSNRFSNKTFTLDKFHFQMNSESADGKLDIYFHNMDVRYKALQNLIKDENDNVPYNYAVITIEDVGTAVHCAMELEEALINCDKNGVPIILRMDNDRRLADYVSKNEGVLNDVRIMADRKNVLSLDMILGKEIDRKAKDFNHFYSNIKIIEGNSSDNNEIVSGDSEKEWNSLKLFRRDSNRAAAYHEEVKDVILDRLSQENGVQLERKIKEIAGENGNLFVYDGKVWKLKGTEEEFMEALKKDRFAFEIASLEHRRWCYFMASLGWKKAERNDRKRTNPCIVTQKELMRIMPEMCKYDIMSLMARLKKMEE